MYVILSGYLPFDGFASRILLHDSYRPTMYDTVERVMAGKFCFPEELFGNISTEATWLITRMLTYNPTDRPSAGAFVTSS